MQTDAKELRAAAERIKSGANAYREFGGCEGLMPVAIQTMDITADYILATVREDDGEEQPETVVFHKHMTVRVTRLQFVWVSIDCNGDAVSLSFPSLTRRQFRALCEGLGVNPEEVK